MGPSPQGSSPERASLERGGVEVLAPWRRSDPADPRIAPCTDLKRPYRVEPSAQPPREVPNLGAAGAGDKYLEVVLHTAQPVNADLAGPGRSQLLEDLRREDEHLFASWSPHEHRGPGVVGVGVASDIADPFQPVRCLGSCLFAYPQTAAQLADRGALGPDGLEGKAVDGPCLAVAVLFKLDMKVVDQPSKSAGEQEGQVEAGAILAHVPILPPWTRWTTRCTIFDN